jgi:hypothetical protein
MAECTVKHWGDGHVVCPVCDGEDPEEGGCLVCKGAGLIPCMVCERSAFVSFLVNLQAEIEES